MTIFYYEIAIKERIMKTISRPGKGGWSVVMGGR